MAKSPEFIDEITICGYKSIAQPLTLHLAPLTMLTGRNSSGKSSVMQPLLLLKQTIEAPYDPGALLIDGPNIRFTAIDQMLSKFSVSSLAQSLILA